MVLHGGGFTFIPKSAIKNGTLPNLVSQLFTNHSEVLLYIQKKDGSQTYTHIQQLKEKSQTPLVVQDKLRLVCVNMIMKATLLMMLVGADDLFCKGKWVAIAVCKKGGAS
jgi:hypothetical protein